MNYQPVENIQCIEPIYKDGLKVEIDRTNIQDCILGIKVTYQDKSQKELFLRNNQDFNYILQVYKYDNSYGIGLFSI